MTHGKPSVRGLILSLLLGAVAFYLGVVLVRALF
jgi:hypothetical protein